MEWEGLGEMRMEGKVEEMCRWTLKTSGNACGNLFLQQLPKVYICMHEIKWSCFITARQCFP